MPLNSHPTKTDASIGRPKSDAEPLKDIDTQVPAAELEAIKSYLIDVCDEVGIHVGGVGSLNARMSPVETKLSGIEAGADVTDTQNITAAGAFLADGSVAMTGAFDGGGFAISNVGTVDGRTLSADGLKLDGIEAGADVTTAAKVSAAGAFMADGSVALTGAADFGGFNLTNVGTVAGRNLASDGLKLDGIEVGADVTDAGNVAAAGALFADGSIPMTGNLVMGDGVTNHAITNVTTVAGRDISTDGAKLDGIEAGADVTDAANVIAAGAFMADGSVAATGALNLGGFAIGNVGTVDGRNLSADGTKLDTVESGADVTDAANVASAGALFADGSVPMTGNLVMGDGITNHAITNVTTVDGRDLATDGTKLDGIEAGADITDYAGVKAAGSIMSDGTVSMAAALNLGGNAITGAGSIAGTSLSLGGGNITSVGTVDGRNLSVDGTKLDGVEAGADVTDAANVGAAGALFADGSVPMTGNLVMGDGITNHAITNVTTVDGRDLATDGAKLDGVEAGADVTDTANVTAAGALLADGTVAMTGALNMGNHSIQSVLAVDGRNIATDGAKLDGIEVGADVTDYTNVKAAGSIMSDGTVAMGANLQLGNGVTNYNIVNVGTVDGRDLATDGAKLDGVEAGADVTDYANVKAAGSIMSDGSVAMANELIMSGNAISGAGAIEGTSLDLANGNIVNVGTVDGRDLSTDGSKLDGIEAGADVTDYANVKAAGGLMADGTVAMSGSLSMSGNAITAVGPQGPLTTSASFTLKSDHNGRTIMCVTTQGGVTVTCPALSAGTTVTLIQSGESTVTLSASGTTLDPGSGFTSTTFTDGASITVYYETQTYIRVLGERGEA